MQATARTEHQEPSQTVDEHRLRPAVPRRSGGRRAFLVLGAVVASALVGVGSYAWLTRNRESTDDATVEADVVAVSPRVAGRIAKVLVRGDQHVHAHQVLALIDDSNFKVRLDQALAELASATAAVKAAEAEEEVAAATASGGLKTAQASVSRSRVDVSGAEAHIAMARAELRRARADRERAQLERQRDEGLFKSGAISAQQWDEVRLSDDAAEAGLERAESALAAAEQQKRALTSELAAAKGHLAQSVPVDARIAAARATTALAKAREQEAHAAVELARLKLGYTKIESPAEGAISALQLNPGEMVRAGQPLAQLVPSDNYVVANFKETQVGKMHAGDHATIEVDAYPEREFSGVVTSLSAGTGARFSVLPASNATGNFVKVVQRVPVHIDWAEPPDVVMRAGMSVVARVELGTR